MSFKNLLLEGFDNSRLIVVIPFVCKILEQCMSSFVFKPPNPWVMAIMKILAELYHYADLKLNLKFEIEVLCKSMHLDVKDIEPSHFLKTRNTISDSNQMAKNFERLAIAPSTVSAPPGSTGLLSAGSNPPITANVDNSQSLMANLVVFNPALQIFQTEPNLKKLVVYAIDSAIQDIINPVVERSVTIAGIATRELVIKDFALEPDENKMRNAAHLMVQSLSGSLASITCREPLRLNMLQNIKASLNQNNISEQLVNEQAIFQIVNENIDKACQIVEKTAAEKAIAEIDEGLNSSFANRRKHREMVFFNNLANWYSLLRYECLCSFQISSNFT